MLAGAELHQARVDAARQAADASQAVLHELHLAVNDLLERQDVILASYDRRVAALANRMLDLEEQLSPRTEPEDRIADANSVLAEHAARAEHEQADEANGKR